MLQWVPQKKNLFFSFVVFFFVCVCGGGGVLGGGRGRAEGVVWDGMGLHDNL